MVKGPAKSCTVCDKPSVDKYRPFCSARCADIDLGRWLGQRYRIETNETPDQVKNTDEDTDIE